LTGEDLEVVEFHVRITRMERPKIREACVDLGDVL
jgi:hypothetical protein